LLGSAQRLFGTLTFSCIDNSAHELHKMTALVANRMTDGVDVLDGAARVNNSVICFELRFFANGLFEQFPHSFLILRTKALKEYFESRRPGVRIETKHAISFLRPVPDFARGGPPRPTPRAAEPLCFRGIGFTLT